MVRTTLNLPEDVYQAARFVAALRGVSLGDAVAELVRKGLGAEARIDPGRAFPCFTVPEDAEPITLERTLTVEEEV